MSEFKSGQIWLVNFDPSFGHEYKKVRPALIVQNDKFIASSNLLTVIPISSQTDKKSELDILLKKESRNRLFADSLIKTKQLSSFDKRRFLKLIGSLNEETMDQVKEYIRIFLA